MKLQSRIFVLAYICCFLCQILYVYLCHISSLLLVCVLQFFNSMIVTGFVISFVTAAMLIMWIQVSFIYVLLWPPCVADADIIFLPGGFFLSSSFLFLA